MYIRSIEDCTIKPMENGYFYLKWHRKISKHVAENKTVEIKFELQGQIETTT